MIEQISDSIESIKYSFNKLKLNSKKSPVLTGEIIRIKS